MKTCCEFFVTRYREVYAVLGVQVFQTRGNVGDAGLARYEQLQHVWDPHLAHATVQVVPNVFP